MHTVPEHEYLDSGQGHTNTDEDAITHIRWLLIPLALLVVTYLGVQGIFVRDTRPSRVPQIVSVPTTQGAPVEEIQNIRKIDFSSFLGKTEFQDCLVEDPLRKPVLIKKEFEGIFYADLTGDGVSDAVVNGWSCWSGTGGPDALRVFTISATGSVLRLPVEDHHFIFQGVDYSKGFGGHNVYRVENGTLVEIFPVYRKEDPNCCPEGGWRKFIYSWNGERFVVESVSEERIPGSIP